MIHCMTPVFAIGDASTAIRLLVGKAVLVSYAWLGSSFVPWGSLQTVLDVAKETTCDCGAFTRWQRRLKGLCESCGTAATAADERVCDKCKAAAPAFTLDLWAEFIEGNYHRFKRFVSPDVIGDAEASMKNWQQLLAMLAPRHHHRVMPVWHEGDPIEHLEEYDPNARLVSIGRTKGRQAGAAGKKATRVFYDEAFNRFPDGDFWALGNGTPETLEPYPFRYFDQTTWQRDSAYSQSHGYPWSAVSKDTRMRAYIEASETITYRPVQPPKQGAFEWARHEEARSVNAAELDELLRHAAAGGEAVLYRKRYTKACFELVTLVDGEIVTHGTDLEDEDAEA